MSLSSGKNKERNENGIFPVYHSQQILIARVGANCGYVYLANGQYDVTDNTLILNVKKEYSLKYFYYLLQSMELNQYSKGGAQPLIIAGVLKNLEIPVPPLETQEKIAGTLDKFTELISNIEREIVLRKKQYEFYREKLLTFDSVI